MEPPEEYYCPDFGRPAIHPEVMVRALLICSLYNIASFIDRIGRDGFGEIFDGLNDELQRMGLLSPEMYVDSSLVEANVNRHDLSPSGMSVAGFSVACS